MQINLIWWHTEISDDIRMCNIWQMCNIWHVVVHFCTTGSSTGGSHISLNLCTHFEWCLVCLLCDYTRYHSKCVCRISDTWCVIWMFVQYLTYVKNCDNCDIFAQHFIIQLICSGDTLIVSNDMFIRTLLHCTWSFNQFTPVADS